MLRFVLSLILIFAPIFSFAQEEYVSPLPPEIPSPIDGTDLVETDSILSLTEDEIEVLIEAGEFPPPSLTGGIIEPPANTVECFADGRYRFGSVSADPELDLNGTVAGVPLTFRVTMENDNPYPITDTAVYVKIFEVREDGEWRHQNGDRLVDQFFAKEGIVLNAHATTSFYFDWNTPQYIKSGNYRAVTYVTTSHRYNLLGLSFTDDVTGNQTEFTISSEQDKVVEWDKDTVKIQDEQYRFAAFTPKLSATSAITIAPELVNNTATDQIVTVIWKLYNWDAQRAENLLKTTEETFLLTPNQTLRPTYEVTDNTHSVYYLVAEAKWRDTSSILDIRFTREGVDAPRINFPSITHYPLKANEPVELFSCLHNAGTSDIVPSNTLVLTLKDNLGAVLHTYTYNGDITGAMMAVADNFTPTTDLTSFSLTATLKQGDEVLDETTTTYNCHELGTECPVEMPIATDSDGSSIETIMIFVLLITIAVFGFIIYRRHQGSKNSFDDTNQPSSSSKISSVTLGAIICVLIGLGGGFLNPGEVEAYSTTQWSFSGVPNLFYYWTCGGSTACGGSTGWIKGLSGAGGTITYKARMRNYDTGAEIPTGATIPIGTRIVFEKVAYSDSDIAWYGTGHSMDTPNGSWINNASAPADPLLNYYYVGISNTLVNQNIKIYIPFSVSPPSTSVQLLTGGLSCSGVVCTVTGVGSVGGRVNFSGTFGRFYYRYVSSFGTYNYFTGVPMRIVIAEPNCTTIQSCLLGGTVASSDYILSIPGQHIDLYVNAYNPNNPPAAPTISEVGGNSHYTGEAQSFTFRAADPDGNQIRYLIDWNNDGIGDIWLPSSGRVNSNTILTAPPHTWTTAGSKTIKAITEDSNGTYSANWSSYTININDAPLATVSLTTSPTKVNKGQSTTLTWNGITNANHGCTASSLLNGNPSTVWSGAKNIAGSSETITNLAAGKHRFTLTCYNSNWVPAISSVEVEVASVNLTANSCYIAENAKTCPTTVSWNFSYAEPTYLIKNIDSNHIFHNGSNANSSGVENIKTGTYRIYAYHKNGADALNYVTVSSQCNPATQNGKTMIINTHPSSGNCEYPPDPPIITIITTPQLVRSGTTANIEVTTTSAEKLKCKLLGANATADEWEHAAGANSTDVVSSVKTITSKDLFHKQQVMVECVVDRFPIVKNSVSASIDVVGTQQEI